MKAKWLSAGATAAAIAGLSAWLLSSPYPTPEAALAAFYGGEPRAECMQNQPLRSEGRRVVPFVIRDLPNRKMPRRRYAIAFLGWGQYAEALPVLETILTDQTEVDYFRADALLAIYEIAPDRARTLASQAHDASGLLERFIQDLGRGDAAMRAHINHACSW